MKLIGILSPTSVEIEHLRKFNDDAPRNTLTVLETEFKSKPFIWSHEWEIRERPLQVSEDVMRSRIAGEKLTRDLIVFGLLCVPWTWVWFVIWKRRHQMLGGPCQMGLGRWPTISVGPAFRPGRQIVSCPNFGQAGRIQLNSEIFKWITFFYISYCYTRIR